MNSLVIGTENFANSVASSGSKAVNNAQAKLASSPAPASTQQNDSQRNAAKQKLEQLEMNDREYYEEAISEIKRLQDEISQYQSTASFISDTTQKNQMMNYVNKQKEEMQYWNNIKSLFNLAYPELKESQINLTDLLYLSGLK
jgi:ATP-dependent 26S proteasome regulatory subunit